MKTKGGMSAKLRVLRAVGVAIAGIAAATQVADIALSWWNFDPRLSCDRLPSWEEWLQCLHGVSHSHVIMTENALIAWIVAGAALLLGRILPPYISIVLPAVAAAGLTAHLARFWRESFVAYAPFGETTLKDALTFAGTALPLTLFLLCPIVGAWLLGIYRRYRPPRAHVEVFD